VQGEIILSELTTQFIGRNVIYYPSIPSTMDEAKRAATEGAAEGTIVVAEEQTGGRGRLGRVWLSPKGNIAMSLILYPNLEQLPRLNMVASLAVAQAIEKVSRLKAELKWPNDVLIRGKKVCGILVESALRGEDVAWAIVGIGVNVNIDPASLPGPATSLSSELGHEVSQAEMLKCLLEELEQLYIALQRREPIYEQWRGQLSTLGKKVRVGWGERVEEGYAESVDSEGHLLLRRSDGSLLKIAAGEVTLRP
jgi:BirA family biotin operon repressor/biotin-[acetyl-CoA-carboxylase] ligase